GAPSDSPPTLTMASALLKGLSLLHVRNFVTDRFGPEAWTQLTGSLTPDDRRVLASAVATGWYELALYARLLNAMDRQFGAGDRKLVMESARYQAEKDLNVVFRVFFGWRIPAGWWPRRPNTGIGSRHAAAGKW